MKRNEWREKQEWKWMRHLQNFNSIQKSVFFQLHFHERTNWIERGFDFPPLPPFQTLFFRTFLFPFIPSFPIRAWILSNIWIPVARKEIYSFQLSSSLFPMIKVLSVYVYASNQRNVIKIKRERERESHDEEWMSELFFPWLSPSHRDSLILEKSSSRQWTFSTLFRLHPPGSLNEATRFASSLIHSHSLLLYLLVFLSFSRVIWVMRGRKMYFVSNPFHLRFISTSSVRENFLPRLSFFSFVRTQL